MTDSGGRPTIAPESLRVRTARALHDAEYQPCRDGYDDCQMADHYLRLADAAIAVRLTPGEAVGDPAAAVARVEALADRYERLADEYLLASRSPGVNLGQSWDGQMKGADLQAQAEAIRAALAQPAPAATDEAGHRG